MEDAIEPNQGQQKARFRQLDESKRQPYRMAFTLRFDGASQNLGKTLREVCTGELAVLQRYPVERTLETVA